MDGNQNCRDLASHVLSVRIAEEKCSISGMMVGHDKDKMIRKSHLGETIDFLALAVKTLSAGDSSMALFGKKLEIWPSPGYVR